MRASHRAGGPGEGSQRPGGGHGGGLQLIREGGVKAVEREERGQERVKNVRGSLEGGAWCWKGRDI